MKECIYKGVKMKLNKGEIVCPDCNGDSWIHEEVKEKGIVYTRYCRYCDGEGKLEWIDNLVNKNKLYTQKDSETFIIKNITLFETIWLGTNMRLKPNQHMYYSCSNDSLSTKIFDSIIICKHMKKGKLLVYESPRMHEMNSYTKYNKMLQIITYGELLIKNE